MDRNHVIELVIMALLCLFLAVSAASAGPFAKERMWRPKTARAAIESKDSMVHATQLELADTLQFMHNDELCMEGTTVSVTSGSVADYIGGLQLCDPDPRKEYLFAEVIDMGKGGRKIAQERRRFKDGEKAFRDKSGRIVMSAHCLNPCVEAPVRPDLPRTGAELPKEAKAVKGSSSSRRKSGDSDKDKCEDPGECAREVRNFLDN